jgi:hypothetical protein
MHSEERAISLSFQDGHCIVAEVKTTDAYRINLDTVTRYREALIAAGKLTKESSVSYGVLVV